MNTILNLAILFITGSAYCQLFSLNFQDYIIHFWDVYQNHNMSKRAI